MYIVEYYLVFEIKEILLFIIKFFDLEEKCVK